MINRSKTWTHQNKQIFTLKNFIKNSYQSKVADVPFSQITLKSISSKITMNLFTIIIKNISTHFHNRPETHLIFIHEHEILNQTLTLITSKLSVLWHPLFCVQIQLLQYFYYSHAWMVHYLSSKDLVFFEPMNKWKWCDFICPLRTKIHFVENKIQN